MIELVLGGARSGKSRYAEQRALESGKQCFYIATAQARDEEMRRRIETHKQRRAPGWTTVEEPLHLGGALNRCDDAGRCILVDCLTLWISNLLLAGGGVNLEERKQELLEALPRLAADVYLVSNEVGWGIVPMGELSRRFVDEAGWLMQDLARICDRVTLVVAGLPTALKRPETGMA
ncbi:MAG TPA: bifunctional adenosylcobinamide kinase/adenosylcobinamide-phosphate guanylyltransferase [Gammaproteobacteria bacterium]|nr:bifunctional adenosylcobinamide kinase/adenosylcobinamide-phosphate guanylyltransferase [Gammaproteobacteria bacterium]